MTHRQFLDAVEWIASERGDWPFAFVHVCSFLGVDAAAVRKRLRIGGAQGKLPSACRWRALLIGAKVDTHSRIISRLRRGIRLREVKPPLNHALGTNASASTPQ